MFLHYFAGQNYDLDTTAGLAELTKAVDATVRDHQVLALLDKAKAGKLHEAEPAIVQKAKRLAKSRQPPQAEPQKALHAPESALIRAAQRRRSAAA